MPQIIDGNQENVECSESVVVVHFDLILDDRGQSDIYIVGRDERGNPVSIPNPDAGGKKSPHAKNGQTPVLYTYSVAGSNPFEWLKDLSLFSNPEYDILGNWSECDAYAINLNMLPKGIARIDFGEAMCPRLLKRGYPADEYDTPEQRPVSWRGSLVRDSIGWRFEAVMYKKLLNLDQFVNATLCK